MVRAKSKSYTITNFKQIKIKQVDNNRIMVNKQNMKLNLKLILFQNYKKNNKIEWSLAFVRIFETNVNKFV